MEVATLALAQFGQSLDFYLADAGGRKPKRLLLIAKTELRCTIQTKR